MVKREFHERTRIWYSNTYTGTLLWQLHLLINCIKCRLPCFIFNNLTLSRSTLADTMDGNIFGSALIQHLHFFLSSGRHRYSQKNLLHSWLLVWPERIGRLGIEPSPISWCNRHEMRHFRTPYRSFYKWKQGVQESLLLLRYQMNGLKVKKTLIWVWKHAFLFVPVSTIQEAWYGHVW